jgi:MYXO-CTERM domain-containing protein
MKKMISSLLVAVCFVMTIGVGTGNAAGTTTTYGNDGIRANDLTRTNNNYEMTSTNNGGNYRATATTDNRIDWGWLGLLGLIGLAGLRGRSNERHGAR